MLRVTVFSPDDLALVKGGPSERRGFLDDALVALAVKYDAIRLELDRILRQRNTLLRQVGGRLDSDAETTLDVWDSRLAATGEQLGRARGGLVSGCAVRDSGLHELAGAGDMSLGYAPRGARRTGGSPSAAARADDVRRGVSTVGPHRDDLDLTIDGMPARTHASQGEQRTLALALRLGVHELVAERTGSAPVLVLDDVLSELDARRAAALMGLLPDGQIVITTAGTIPAAAAPERVIRIEGGTIVPA